MAEVSEVAFASGTILEQLREGAIRGPENPYGIDRFPFIITTEEFVTSDPSRAVFLYCNPSEVSFQQGIRGAEQKVRGGSVQHVWFDRIHRKTFFDEPTLGFQFQSGSTHPVFLENGVDVRAAPGLVNVWDLLEILDQPRVLPDGRPNFVYIVYSSRNFPQLTMTGFFTPEGFSFTDSASDPTQLNLSANFVMYDSYPRLNNPALLNVVFSSYGLRGANNRPNPKPNPNAPKIDPIRAATIPGGPQFTP